eukprot:6210665-Pleurochrysis_carterae.AAC.4
MLQAAPKSGTKRRIIILAPVALNLFQKCCCVEQHIAWPRQLAPHLRTCIALQQLQEAERFPDAQSSGESPQSFWQLSSENAVEMAARYQVDALALMLPLLLRRRAPHLPLPHHCASHHHP